jgi:hypothetical protein
MYEIGLHPFPDENQLLSERASNYPGRCPRSGKCANSSDN